LALEEQTSLMGIRTAKRVNQVKAYMLDYIDRNRLKRNDQLPSEASIATDLGVSRNTLREAYIALESEGIIVRRHGIGTFVAQLPVIQDSLNDFSSFGQIIQDSGYTPIYKTLSMSFDLAPACVYNVFSRPSSEKIRCIKRIVQADQKPVIYVEDYFSPVVEQASLDWDVFDGKTVQFLASGLDTPLHQIQSCIRAAAIDPEISPLLQLAPGTSILSVRSTIFTVDNLPITYSNICFNSNFMELHIVRLISTE
jgi:GntR family transcriptional regulator